MYRRYRPETFAEVIGQDHVTAPLRNALSNNRVNHAYLFSGPRGCGKTTSARILARAINCEKGPIAEPCGVCKSCTDLARGGPGSIDVIEIDAASHGGVDDARDLRERAFFAPVESRYKIYIIDEAHMVTTQGFNALLKLVEEPPPHLKFIFATTEPDKVIGTIRSRTHHYPFRLVPPKALADYMATLCESEGVAIEPAALPLVVRAGAGSVRDSLSVLDQLIGGAGPDGVTYELAVALLGFTPDSLLDACVDGFAAHDSAAVFETIEKVIETGQDPKRFAEDLLRRLRDLVILSAVPTAVTSGLIEAAEDQGERLQTQAAGIGPAELTRAADIVAAGLLEMRGATAPRLQLELICAKVLLPGADDSTNGIQARLDRMERRLAIGVPGGAADLAPGTAGAATGGQAGAGQVGGTAGTARVDSSGDDGHSAPAAAATSRAAARAAASPGASASSGAVAPGAAVPDAVAPGGAAAAGPGGRVGDAGHASGGDQSAGGPDASGAESDVRSGGGAPVKTAGGGVVSPAAQASGGGARTGAWGDEPSTPSSSPAQSGQAPQPGESPASAQSAPSAASGQSAQAAPPAASGQAGAGGAVGGSGVVADGAETGAVGLADVRRLWPQVLEAVKTQRRFAWIMLSQNAQVIAIDDQTLTLGLVNAGARESFARSGSDEILRQAMIDTIGINRRVEAVVDPSTDPGAGGGSAGRPAPQPGGPGRPGGSGPQSGGSPGSGGPAAGPGGPSAGGPGTAVGPGGAGPGGAGTGGPGASGPGTSGPGSSGPGSSGPGSSAGGGMGAGRGAADVGGAPGSEGGDSAVPSTGAGSRGAGPAGPLADAASPGAADQRAAGLGAAGPGAGPAAGGPGVRGDGRTGQWGDGPGGAVALQEPPDEYDVPPEDPWEDGPAARPQRQTQPVADRREQAASKRRAAEAAVAAEQARQASAAAAAPEVPLTPEEEADSIGEDDVVLEEDSRSHTDLLRETLGAQIITEEPN
nr:DNA polymerase III subunit gamma and tau [Kribbella shirazensis]